MLWEVTSFYSSVKSFLTDVCDAFVLPVHLLKCQLRLLSQSLKAKRCPFLIQLQLGYNLIKIPTHSPPSGYGAQIVFTVRQPFCVCVCKPECLPTPVCLTPSVSACFSVLSTSCLWAYISEWAKVCVMCSLICNLCHMSLSFSPTVFILSEWKPNCRWFSVSKYSSLKKNPVNSMSYFF